MSRDQLTIGELKEIIADMPDDLDVRMALRNGARNEYAVADAILINDHLYMLDGGPIGYMSKEVREASGL